jgi:threonyl-tRNA synthetase
MSESEDRLYAMRHSAAHVLATAVSHLYKGAKFGVGPVIDNGFYYDFDLGDSVLSEADLEKIEKEMASIIAENQQFVKSVSPIEEAITWAQDNDQPYKLELLNDLKNSGTTDVNELKADNGQDSGADSVSFYTNGDFRDLCRGPHVESTGQIGPFKLTKVSGAYWRGNEHNKQLQRVYGVAFDNQEDLSKYLEAQEEAKKRDHRKIGQEMDLFLISDLVGSGLPLFTTRGTVLRNELIKYSEELQMKRGYQAVWAPHMAKIDLYKKSGHFDKFPERFDVTSQESDDNFMLKPMNCPHVIQIYASKPRSYRDLPLRLMETTTMYRDEKKGELHGLSRVRSLTQDDAHAFVRYDQIEQEIKAVVQMVKEMYKTLDMSMHVELSFRDDSDKYFGDKKLWAEAESTIEDIAKAEELEYEVIKGEAAFYGPKIDIRVSDALGRAWQCATIQLDFVMPDRFDISYTSDKGEKLRPAIIHKAILGSIERFLSVYIEHTAGRFPVWLAPEQIRILTLNQTEEVENFANQLLDKAFTRGLRATIDNNSESVGKKIREAEVMKVPYVLVIGSKEIESSQVTPRVRKDLTDNDSVQPLSLDDFLAKVEQEHKNRTLRSTL